MLDDPGTDVCESLGADAVFGGLSGHRRALFGQIRIPPDYGMERLLDPPRTARVNHRNGLIVNHEARIGSVARVARHGLRRPVRSTYSMATGTSRRRPDQPSRH